MKLTLFKLPDPYVRINGKYVGNWNRKQWIVYRLSFYFQKLLYTIGISWHNSIGGECTPDFSCCTKRKTGKKGAAALVDMLSTELKEK